MQRYIGIIGDGPTDYLVFKKIVETLLPNTVAVIDLRRQTLHDAVDKYWKDTNKNRDLLKKAVKGILHTALSDFQAGMDDDSLTSCKDIILLTTDAEKPLAFLNNESTYWESKGDYFGILNCLMDAIKDFSAIQYQQPEYLPRIIPVVTFPSIEPILLIGKGEKLPNINGKKPTDLKRLLYKTDNPSGEEIEQAIAQINENKIYEILKIIPESRFLIQTLLMFN